MNGIAPLGTPTVAATATDGNLAAIKAQLKQDGKYWIAALNIDCNQTTDGWFEVKVRALFAFKFKNADH